MQYKIIHRNAMDCVISDEQPFSDVLECNNKMAEYVRSNEVYPGDILTIIEL